MEETLDLAFSIHEVASDLKIPWIFKGSFDKANRTSPNAYRGPGLEKGLEILGEVQKQVGVEVITDIHEPWQAAPVAKTVDVVQIPAFLCRQTDLIVSAAEQGKPMLIKKGQFAAPPVAIEAAKKAAAAGCHEVMLCERGFAFGYNDLVFDLRSLVWLRNSGFPVLADVSHAAQRPSAVTLGNATGYRSGGDRSLIPVYARAAVAVGVDGLFIECHRDPDTAPVDSATQWPVGRLKPLLTELCAIAQACR